MKSKNDQILLIAYNKGYKVNKNGEVYFKDRKRSLILCTKGYYTFTIRCNLGDNDIFRRVWVHKLQAYQKFSDKIFEKDIQVRHLNNNKNDNSWNNILIGTQSDNMMDIPKQIRKAKSLHASSFIKKYNKEEVKKFHKENGNSYKKTKEYFNISSSGTLYYVLNK